MGRWYILDNDHKPVSTNVLDAARWMEEDPNNKVVKQEEVNDTFVSTVFLGLDHSWNSDIPVLWETMIFGGEHDQYQDRYCSYEDALEGHQRAVNLINNSKKFLNTMSNWKNKNTGEIISQSCYNKLESVRKSYYYPVMESVTHKYYENDDLISIGVIGAMFASDDSSYDNDDSSSRDTFDGGFGGGDFSGGGAEGDW
jgi:uncharacterized membrane protein YgcG